MFFTLPQDCLRANRLARGLHSDVTRNRFRLTCATVRKRQLPVHNNCAWHVLCSARVHIGDGSPGQVTVRYKCQPTARRPACLSLSLPAVHMSCPHEPQMLRRTYMAAPTLNTLLAECDELVQRASKLQLQVARAAHPPASVLCKLMDLHVSIEDVNDEIRRRFYR